MNALECQKRIIALEHLYAAKRLYVDGNAFSSSLLLAASAEEIFGQLLKNPVDRYKEGGSNSHALEDRVKFARQLSNLLDQEQKDEQQIRRVILHPKNFVKHFSREGALLKEVKQEARGWLLEAIDNLLALDDRLPKDIEHFQEVLRAEETNEVFLLYEKIKGQSHNL